MKKILVIMPLIFSLGLIGCSGNSDTKEEEKETSKVEQKDTFSEIKSTLKDMYLAIQGYKDDEDVCKEKIEKLNEDITDEMLANEEYEEQLKNLESYIENYDLAKISQQICDILNDMENTDVYKLDLTSTNENSQENKNSNTTTQKSTTNKSTTKKSTTKSDTKNNKSKTSTKENTQKCPKCGSTNYNGVVCSDCGYQMSDPPEEECPDCGYHLNDNGTCSNCGYGKKNNDNNNEDNSNEENSDHEEKCSNCGSATLNDDGTCPYCGHQN